MPQSRAWDNWPQEAVDAVTRAVELNDAKTHRISRESLAKYLADTYQIRVSRSILQDFCKSVLGRSSWGVP